MAAARGLVVKDFVLTPGQALFLPVGWWHCVRALDPSASIGLVDFIWPNNWESCFPPG
jgi:ribosomal protein L16 Arg81 hydroxylase